MDCIPAYDESEILQGDIFKLTSSKDENENLLVVISADCDLANQKYGDKGIVCLSILPVEKFFRNEHCYEKAIGMLHRKEKRVGDIINSAWLEKSVKNKVISHANIIKWIRDDSIENIIKSLSVQEKKKREDIVSQCANLKLFYNLLSKNPLLGIELLTCIEGKDATLESEKVQVLKNAIKSFKNNPPLDSFFISSIPGFDDVGYIVRMRKLVFLPRDSCFFSFSIAKEVDSSYVRVARLTPTFKHALAQQFGTLFSRIGFPTDYEEDRVTAFELIIDNLNNKESLC